MRLFYREKNPDAPITLFFLHGNSNAGVLWQPQYYDESFDTYRLVVFDLPGHGFSSGIPSGDYSLPNMARIMTDAVEVLAGGKPYGLVGFSLGGNITSEMLAFDINPKALVFLSTGLVGEGITPADVAQSELVVEVLFSENPSRDRVMEYFTKLPYVPDADVKAEFLAHYDRTDPAFRRSFFQTVGLGLYSDELSLIRKWNGSPLMAYGSQDDIISPHLLDRITLPYWSGRIVKIDKAAHLVNRDRPDILNPLMRAYFDESFQR